MIKSNHILNINGRRFWKLFTMLKMKKYTLRRKCTNIHHKTWKQLLKKKKKILCVLFLIYTSYCMFLVEYSHLFIRDWKINVNKNGKMLEKMVTKYLEDIFVNIFYVSKRINLFKKIVQLLVFILLDICCCLWFWFSI